MDRSIKLNEFANKLNIKLIEMSSNCVLNTGEYISNGKNLKIKPINWSLKNKCLVFCSELPFRKISSSGYVSIETMNIISSDVEMTENYF